MNKIEIVNTTAETEQTQNKLYYECKKEYDEDHSYENYSIKNDNKILDKPLDRIKEFLGYEMEKKLQFYGRFSKGNFDNIQRAVFHNGFLSIAGLGDLKWVFNFDYYGYMDNKRLTRSVVLIHHPSTNKFWIKT